jgi:transposase-like protein
MSSIVERIKIVFALVREHGLRKTIIAYQESLNDRNFIYCNCPKCGAEHHIHKLTASRDMIRCTNCRTYFVVNKAPAEEAAFIKVFGRK